MTLTPIEESLLVAAYYRGGNPDDRIWISNCDQVVTLSLFYTGDISADDCAERFSRRSYVGSLCDASGELDTAIEARYRILIDFIQERTDLIAGGGSLDLPAHPTYTSCRLTESGQGLARSLVGSFPRKPAFPHWPDKQDDV